MGVIIKAKANNGLTARRGMALALLLCFFAALILTQAFAVTHAGHDHNHAGMDGGCTVCAFLTDAQGRLNQSGALSRISAVSAAVLAEIPLVFAALSSVRNCTLVHLNIQSNC